MHVTRDTHAKRMLARIMRRGESYEKAFPRKKYKTWKDAEAAARRWVKAKLKQLPPPVTPQKGMLTRRNQSGLVGVWLACKSKRSPYDEKKVYEYWNWVARWPGCDLAGGISWSVSQYDDDGAFVLAALSLELESTDRDAILTRYKRIRSTKKYGKILAKKQLYLEG